MSWMIWDPDEWENVSEFRPCTGCVDSRCTGRCNGMASMGQRRRAPEDVLRIKAERREREDHEILKKAEAIRARRQLEAEHG